MRQLELRAIASDVLIAVQQQQRVLTAAGRLSDADRRAVRDLLIQAQKQAGLNFWEGACELVDEKENDHASRR